MTNQSTIDKLIEMHLSSMADAFRIQMNDSTMKEVPFEGKRLISCTYSQPRISVP